MLYGCILSFFKTKKGFITGVVVSLVAAGLYDVGNYFVKFVFGNRQKKDENVSYNIWIAPIGFEDRLGIIDSLPKNIIFYNKLETVPTKQDQESHGAVSVGTGIPPSQYCMPNQKQQVDDHVSPLRQVVNGSQNKSVAKQSAKYNEINKPKTSENQKKEEGDYLLPIFRNGSPLFDSK